MLWPASTLLWTTSRKFPPHSKNPQAQKTSHTRKFSAHPKSTRTRVAQPLGQPPGTGSTAHCGPSGVPDGTGVLRDRCRAAGAQGVRATIKRQRLRQRCGRRCELEDHQLAGTRYVLYKSFYISVSTLFADWAAKKWPFGLQKSGVKEVTSRNLRAPLGMCLAARHARFVERSL